jgi:predicted nucleotidyltransferase
MAALTPQRSDELLRLLLEIGVEHIVVGGVAAIAWGSNQLTRDLDVVIPFDAGRIARVLAALAPHHPKHTTRPDLGVITDTPERLAAFRMLLISTDLGRIDLLPEVQPVGGYEVLLSRSVRMDLGGHEHEVIGLDDLIAVKEHVARPKDLVVAAELRGQRALGRHR